MQFTKSEKQSMIESVMSWPEDVDGQNWFFKKEINEIIDGGIIYEDKIKIVQEHINDYSEYG